MRAAAARVMQLCNSGVGFCLSLKKIKARCAFIFFTSLFFFSSCTLSVCPPLLPPFLPSLSPSLFLIDLVLTFLAHEPQPCLVFSVMSQLLTFIYFLTCSSACTLGAYGSLLSILDSSGIPCRRYMMWWLEWKTTASLFPGVRSLRWCSSELDSARPRWLWVFPLWWRTTHHLSRRYAPTWSR